MRRWVNVGFLGVAAWLTPLVLPDSAAVGSEDLASCEWSDEVEIDGAGDGVGGCVCVLVWPFIVFREWQGFVGDAGVGRDSRVGTSVRGAMPVAVAVAEGTSSEQIRISRFLEADFSNVRSV